MLCILACHEMVHIQSNAKPKQKSKMNASASGPPHKRTKTESVDQHYYPNKIPDTADDEESDERNRTLLKDELSLSQTQRL